MSNSSLHRTMLPLAFFPCLGEPSRTSRYEIVVEHFLHSSSFIFVVVVDSVNVAVEKLPCCLIAYVLQLSAAAFESESETESQQRASVLVHLSMI